MRTVASVLGALALVAAAAPARGEEPAAAPAHRWEYVTYPALPCPWGDGGARPMVGYGPKEKGFRFDLSFLTGDVAHVKAPKKGEMVVRLHAGEAAPQAPIEGDGQVPGRIG